MAVSPADFELYSRVTGTPLPRTPQEQMQMAPMVYKFIQNRGYQNPKGFLGNVGDFLAKAALVGGGLALANQLVPYESGGGGVTATEPIATDDDNVLTGFSPKGLLPSGRQSGQITVSPVNISPQTPDARGIVGNVGSIKADLSNAVDRSDVRDSGDAPAVVVTGNKGFDPAPAPRAEAEGLRDIKFSMEPPIQRDPSFFNPTGNWGVGDTANLANAVIDFGVNHGSTVLEQGALDLAKGVRDIQKGYDDVSTVAEGIYDAGAATRGWHDRNLVPTGKRIAGIFTPPELPTTRPSNPIEIGGNSILNDHPDLIQPGTGSDEGPNIPNHVIHGAVDRQGNPFPMSTRVNAPSGIDSAGVPIGYIPQVKVRDVGPDANVTDPVEYQWYGGLKPRQGTMDEATKALRSKHAEWYEPQRLRDDILSDSERVGEATVSGPGTVLAKLANLTPPFSDTDNQYIEPAQQTVEASPEAEAFHGLKQFVRGLTGQDSPVDYETGSATPGFDAYQEFDPKPPKKVPYISKVTGKPTGALVDAGGGSGVEYIGLQDDGDRFMEISFHNKNKAKKTPGGYVFDSYQDATGPSYRDALVTPVADPRITGGAIGDQGIGTTVSDEVMNEKLAKDEREDENERTVKQWLDDKIFGYGEDQVSPTKFAREAKIGQSALSDFIAKNKDRLGGN